MRLDRAASIGDLRQLARKRLPRIVFDFIEGGHGDENCLRRNSEAFAAMRLVPRYLIDVAKRDQSVTLFGRRYSSPFGIGPTGMAALARPRADHHLAAAAAEADIPFVLSGGGNGPIEELAAITGHRLWYQVYGARDRGLTERMVARARDAGVEVLVVTVDVPAARKSDRDIRNGFIRPYRPSPSAFFEALRHPAWIAGYLRHGLPKFDSWVPFAPPGSSARQVAAYLSTQHPTTQTIREIETYRKLWPGKLVVKGILHRDDARQSADAGADGIVISNHGGRGLDHAPATVEVLPAIRDAVGDRVTLMLDSGVRRGADVLIALCLGAKFVFFGRPTLYGVSAGGRDGANRALAILRQEVDLGMGQIGCTTIGALTQDRLVLPA